MEVINYQRTQLFWIINGYTDFYLLTITTIKINYRVDMYITFEFTLRSKTSAVHHFFVIKTSCGHRSQEIFLDI